jgi:hypothetical protein
MKKITIPEELLERLIQELKLAQQDFFVPKTEQRIEEAQKLIDSN